MKNETRNCTDSKSKRYIFSPHTVNKRWGNASAEKFVERTYSVLDTIAQQPFLFKAYQGNDVRKGFITEQTSVVYRVLHDRIEVLFFWDNR